jgi:hypothetical protein
MALHYELEAVESLIKETLHPKNLLTENSISDGQFDNWCQTLYYEKENIQKRLKKVTYSYDKENHRKLYIHQHQFAIIHLKNVLIEYLMPKDATQLIERKEDNKITKLYKRSLVVMQGLLNYVKEEFPQYFNYEEKIPASKLLLLQEGLKSRLGKLKKQLIKGGQDAVLIELLLQTIQIHTNNETCQPLTYLRWNYLKELLTSIERMSPGEEYESHYSSLVVQLVYMNFNATIFKNYFVKLIHSSINAAGSLQEKIEIISFHHKEISQLPVKSGMALAPSLPSVQLDLVTWLFNEMSHLEKKQTLAIVAPVQFKEPGDPDAEKGIYSQLTVEELGLLFKIQKETDLLKNKNMKQVARSVAEHWHSKQKENISWQYLYNSMSTVEMGTMRSLEDKLVGLVNWLRKMKGRL